MFGEVLLRDGPSGVGRPVCQAGGASHSFALSRGGAARGTREGSDLGWEVGSNLDVELVVRLVHPVGVGEVPLFVEK